jgi:hypothetical protein
MFFSLTYIIKPLGFDENDKVELTILEGDSLVKIELVRIPKDDLIPRQHIGQLRCTASFEMTSNESISYLFLTMDKYVPTELRSILNDAQNLLSKAINTAVHTLRWKLGVENSHNPTSSKRYLQWSSNGTDWSGFPGDGAAVSLSVEYGLPMNQISSEEVQICRIS